MQTSILLCLVAIGSVAAQDVDGYEPEVTKRVNKNFNFEHSPPNMTQNNVNVNSAKWFSVFFFSEI